MSAPKTMLQRFTILVSMLLVCVALSAVFSMPAEGASKVKIRIAHDNTFDPNDAYNQMALRFKEIIEKNSNQRFEVTIFAKSYGAEREQLEAVQIGTCDMVVATNAFVGSFAPPAFAMDMPFLFPNMDVANEVQSSPAARAVLDALEEYGFKGLAFGTIGFRHLIVNKPINTIGDCKGLKIRVIENQLYIKTYDAIGVLATPLPFGEVVSGVQQNLIDGLDQPTIPTYTNQLFRVCKYAARINGLFNACILVCNLDFFNALSPEDQVLVMESAEEAARIQRKFATDLEASVEKDLIGLGMTFTEVTDRTPFQNAVQGIYKEYEPRIGGTLLQDLRKAIDEASSK